MWAYDYYTAGRLSSQVICNQSGKAFHTLCHLVRVRTFSLDVLRPLNVEIILGQLSNSVHMCTINFCTQIYSATTVRSIFLISVKKFLEYLCYFK